MTFNTGEDGASWRQGVLAHYPAGRRHGRIPPNDIDHFRSISVFRLLTHGYDPADFDFVTIVLQEFSHAPHP